MMWLPFQKIKWWMMNDEIDWLLRHGMDGMTDLCSGDPPHSVHLSSQYQLPITNCQPSMNYLYLEFSCDRPKSSSWLWTVILSNANIRSRRFFFLFHSIFSRKWALFKLWELSEILICGKLVFQFWIWINIFPILNYVICDKMTHPVLDSTVNFLFLWCLKNNLKNTSAEWHQPLAFGLRRSCRV